MIDLRHPPSIAVKWKCWHTHSLFKICTVEAQTWFKARELAATEMGVSHWDVECELEVEE